MRAAGIAADVVAAWHGLTERMTQAVYGRVTDDRLTAASAVFSGSGRTELGHAVTARQSPARPGMTPASGHTARAGAGRVAAGRAAPAPATAASGRLDRPRARARGLRRARPFHRPRPPDGRRGRARPPRQAPARRADWARPTRAPPRPSRSHSPPVGTLLAHWPLSRNQTRYGYQV
jgi:hypothetical protein